MAKVLVVEDNPVNMKPAAPLLHKAGDTVPCAADKAATGTTDQLRQQQTPHS